MQFNLFLPIHILPYSFLGGLSSIIASDFYYRYWIKTIPNLKITLNYTNFLNYGCIAGSIYGFIIYK
jgi:hypothetical protein